MNTVDTPQPKSIFASIDKRSAEFRDDVSLAETFTKFVGGGFAGLPDDVVLVHVDGRDDKTPCKDSEGKDALRAYAIWKEGQNHFGAWLFFYEEPDSEAAYAEIVYPHILGPVSKKSHEIVEDIYYLSNGLPVAWVTYHNAQS